MPGTPYLLGELAKAGYAVPAYNLLLHTNCLLWAYG
jgi:hypothetical protein